MSTIRWVTDSGGAPIAARPFANRVALCFQCAHGGPGNAVAPVDEVAGAIGGTLAWAMTSAGTHRKRASAGGTWIEQAAEHREPFAMPANVKAAPRCIANLPSPPSSQALRSRRGHRAADSHAPRARSGAGLSSRARIAGCGALWGACEGWGRAAWVYPSFSRSRPRALISIQK